MREFEPAKFWLVPKIELAKQGDFTNTEINEVRKLIIRFEQELKSQLDLLYAGKEFKTIKIKK